MSKAKPEVSLIEAIHRLEDQTPLSPEERKELLPSPAVLAAGKKRALATLERMQQDQAPGPR